MLHIAVNGRVDIEKILKLINYQIKRLRGGKLHRMLKKLAELRYHAY
jgi:hypothetical protein